MVVGRPTRSAQKSGKLIAHFEKPLHPSHTHGNILSGEQKNTLACDSLPHDLHLHSALACSLRLSYLPGDAFSHEFPHSVPQVHMTMRPWQLHGLWPCSLHRKAPGGSLKWTAAGNKLSYWMGTQSALQPPVGSKGL